MKTLLMAATAIWMIGQVPAIAEDEPRRPFLVTGRPQLIVGGSFERTLADLAASRRIEDVVYCIELVEFSHDPWSSNETRSLDDLIPAIKVLSERFDSSIVPLVCFRLGRVRDPCLVNRHLLLIHRLCGGKPESYFEGLEPEGLRVLSPRVSASVSLERSEFFARPGGAAAEAIDALLEKRKAPVPGS